MNGYVLEFKTGGYVFFAENGRPYRTYDLQKMHVFTDLNEAMRIADLWQNAMTVNFVQLKATFTKVG